MEHSPAWYAESSLASQEIPCILWSLKVHYYIHKSLPLAPVLSQHSISKYLKYWNATEMRTIQEQ
jgi:hypothetical protein